MKEADLFKRRIVVVLDYFDDENEIPWDYIQRSGDGKFEAIASHLIDDLYDQSRCVCREHSVGIFDTAKEAVKALRTYLRTIELADRERWHTADGKLDINWPTIN